jgi:signal transduction histidine kinase
VCRIREVSLGVRIDATATNAATQSPESVDRHSLQQLCHDIRQEMAVVHALVEILMAEIDANGPAKKWLDHLRDQSLHMADMLRAVVERGRTEIDLSAFVADVVADVRLRAGTVIRVEAEPARAVVDRSLLRRALVNLLDNAVRAAGPNGVVEVRVRPRSADVLIDVEDTGPGFGRANPGLAALGLRVVHECVGEHGGELELSSGKLGGALARMRIPRPSEWEARPTERR